MDASVVGLIIGIILAIITIYLILTGNKNTIPTKEPVVPQKAAPEVPTAPAFVKADDLTLIEGIGPKIAGILNQFGIKTFAQLAATELPVLEKLLKDNGLQFTKPASWAAQARLAADGKLDELKALQEKLTAGR